MTGEQISRRAHPGEGEGRACPCARRREGLRASAGRSRHGPSSEPDIVVRRVPALTIKTRSAHAPACRSITHEIQELKLRIAEQMVEEEGAEVVETELVRSRDEATAIGQYLLAEKRQQGEQFRKRERQQWRHVLNVWNRVPAELADVLEEGD